jgi:hypothetical protein
VTVAAAPARVLAGRRLAHSGTLLLAAACTALLLLGGFYFVVRQPVIDDFDPSVYVASARALANGQGYRLPAYLAEPQNTFYPPGYSLLLAALLKVGGPFPESLPLLQLASLLLFYGVLVLGALVLRNCYRASPPQIALAVLLAATTPPALILSTQLRSDSLYGALVFASVLLVHLGLKRSGWRATALLAAAGLLATSAFYTRTVGIALLAALVLSVLRQRRAVGAQGVIVALLTAALALPWAIWGAGQGGVGYVRYWADNASDWQLRLLVPLLNYFSGLDVGWIVAPALPLWASQGPVGLARDLPWLSGLPLWVTIAFGCGLLSYVLWHSGKEWWRTGEPIHLYVLLYLILLLPWPLTAGLGGRFLWPLAPVLAWYLVLAVSQSWSRVARGRTLQRLPVPALILGGLLIFNVGWLAEAASRAAAGQWAAHQGAQSKYADMEQVALFLRQQGAPGPVGTNHLASLSWWYLYTGRPGVEALARGDGHESFYVLRAAQGSPEAIRYFIYQRDNGLAEVTTLLQPKSDEDDRPVILAELAARGASTEPVYCTAGETFCVYDWRPRPPPPPAP